MNLKFMDGTSVSVSGRDGDLVKKAIAAGADWIEVRGNQYRVSSITKIEDKDVKIKTVAELGLPELDIPKDMQAAYDQRTMRIDQKSLDSEIYHS